VVSTQKRQMLSCGIPFKELSLVIKKQIMRNELLTHS
jgi:hypothetical protein